LKKRKIKFLYEKQLNLNWLVQEGQSHWFPFSKDSLGPLSRLASVFTRY